MPISMMSPGQKAAAKDISRVSIRAEMADEKLGHGSTRSFGSSHDKGAAAVAKEAWTTAETNGDDPIDAVDNEIRALRANKEEKESPFVHNFNLGMGVAIILNIFLIAVETDYGPEHEDEVSERILWIILDSIFVAIFCIELCCRVFWERSRWINSYWNWFDAAVVALAVIDTWILSFVDTTANLYVLSMMRIVRLVRLVRMVKLVKMFQGVYVMVSAFGAALRSMLILCCMMTFGVLIYGIFATTMIGQNDSFDDVRIKQDTVEERFGTVPRSMYSLFELMTLEGWDEVARPLVTKQPLVFLFIGSFIMLFTFGMLNMVVALVVEKTLQQTRAMSDLEQTELRREMAEQLSSMKTVFHSSDVDGSGTVTAEEFEQALVVNANIRESLAKMGIPVADARELYAVLDFDGDGELTVKEFIEGLANVQSQFPNPWDAVATHAGVKGMGRRVKEMQSQISTLALDQAKGMEKLHCRLDAQQRMLEDILHAVRPNDATLTGLALNSGSPSHADSSRLPTRPTSPSTWPPSSPVVRNSSVPGNWGDSKSGEKDPPEPQPPRTNRTM